MAWKYSGPKTKAHPKGDHRRGKPYLGTTAGGAKRGPDTRYGWIQRVENWIAGRWEGFVISKGKYKTKAEARKHRPKW